MLGLINVLNIEGRKAGVGVNCISPFAVTRMSENLADPALAEAMKPDHVAQGLVWLASADAPVGVILNAGAGRFSVVRLVETRGVALRPGTDRAEDVAAAWTQICDPDGQREFGSAVEHATDFLQRVPSPAL